MSAALTLNHSLWHISSIAINIYVSASERPHIAIYLPKSMEHRHGQTYYQTLVRAKFFRLSKLSDIIREEKIWTIRSSSSACLPVLSQ